MGNKVILCVFGVILLIGALYFLFKSLQSHDARLDAELKRKAEAEARAREEERLRGDSGQAISAEQAEANRKKIEEEAAARRAVREKELQARIEKEKKLAEDRKRLAAEQAKARAEAVAKDEEQRRKAEKQRQEEERVAREAERVQRLRVWLAEVPQTAQGYCLLDTTGLAPAANRPVIVENNYTGLSPLLTRDYSFEDSGQVSIIENVVRLARGLLANEAQNEKVIVIADPQLSLVNEIASADVLQEIHNTVITKGIQGAAEGVEAARKMKVMTNARLSMAVKNLEYQAQQYARYAADHGRSVVRANNASLRTDNSEQLQKTASETRKNYKLLRDELPNYWKALNDLRRYAAEGELFTQARNVAKARLTALGVSAASLPANPNATAAGTAATAPPATSPAAPPAQAKRTITVYVLGDGREIRAVNVVTMGDQLAIKNEQGTIETIEKLDVVRTRRVEVADPVAEPKKQEAPSAP